MADTASRGATIKWIIALCLTASLAVIGWTVTATLATRLRAMEVIQSQAIELKADVAALNVRTAVLENKYDTIHAALAEIKVLIQKLSEK